MIVAQALSKKYGQHEVLRDLSFSIQKGEIIGFLGPNGAGKSTLMKILAGYLPATSGSVSIDGFDLINNSLEIRARLGYLPENIPFYPEMRVGEYLRYRAALKRVPHRRVTEKVTDVLDLCKLRTIEHQLLGTLSKGHHQRVGLADALVNEPDFLILDEPTTALDPNQQREIHLLIKTLAKRHTVLLSTHLLKEAEALCHRIIILNQGAIVASGSLEELRQQAPLHLGRMVSIEVQLTDPHAGLHFFQSLEGVLEVACEDQKRSFNWKRFHLVLDETKDFRESILKSLLQKGWPLREFSSSTGGLEETFATLTRKEEIG
ncbi:MAG: ABC transporter ATP-binding protein [Chthoniobacterales bacterium]|nr:ABC transporter ATP-binding protein [Chthoniobacterales bacterium]